MIRYLLIVSLVFFSFHASASEISDVSQDAHTGAYSKSMSFDELFSGQFAERLSKIISLETEISFQVYAPKAYDPENPPGVLAYISPTRSGEPPATWIEKIENANLIWVSVNNSGNRTSTRNRIIETLACIEFVSQNYLYDPSRSYVSGLSGGGRAASIVAKTYPNIFSGAIYIIGVNPLGHLDPEILEQLKSNRFVFLTGSSDFNRKETELVYRQYKNSGIERSKLIVVSGLGHRVPHARWVEESINFLDSFLLLERPLEPKEDQD